MTDDTPTAPGIPRVPRPAAQIRLFCLTLPTGGLGLEYIKAFDQTGLGVLACPISAFFVTGGPWMEYLHLFVGKPAERYVNVVCAPPGLLMGQALRESDVKPPSGPGLPGLPPASGTPARGSEVVYQPRTALSGLYTAGVPNIAITLPRPKPPDENEILALASYSAVIAPTETDADALRDLGVTALCVPPESVEELGEIALAFLS